MLTFARPLRFSRTSHAGRLISKCSRYHQRKIRLATTGLDNPKSYHDLGILMAIGALSVSAATIVISWEGNDRPCQSKCACEKNSANKDKSFRLKDVYDIEQVLGQGTYGMVYRASRKSDGRVVALKTMPREYTGQTDFEREVAALQFLSKPPSHDHIVKLYDLHRDDKNYYLAMELVEGGELLDHLIEHGPYSEALAASFVRQFAEALCFVHSSGYTHADLKPENLMLSTTTEADNGEGISLKVVDFGCARTHDLGRSEMQLPMDEFATGCSFLHQVALGNQFELERMIQERPNLVNFRDYDRQVLSLSCVGTNEKLNYRRTALHIAAAEGHLDICRFLVVRGARINRVDRWGGSPMDDAHRQGHNTVLQFLGKQGGKFGSAAKAIETFINASSQGKVEEVQALLKFGNIDLDQGDYDRRTALHLAAGEGQLTIVKLLCEAGANTNVKDRWGNRPIDDAKSAKQNSSAILRVLKQHGAKFALKGADFFTNDKNLDAPLVDLAGKSGTMAYWAPELFQKHAMPTPAADVWAAGVIVFILLTGTYVTDMNASFSYTQLTRPFSSHPFDKHANSTEEEIAEHLTKLHGFIEKGDDLYISFMDNKVFDERIEGLSESCVALMKQLMHPDPKKRMTSEDFRRHPWVQGLTASWKTMANGFGQLEAGRWQRHFSEVLRLFAFKHGIGDGKNLSEQDLQGIFRALDVKQNGVLDLDEISAAFRGLDANAESIQKAFKCADLDGTGVIRWDEFRALMSEHFGNEDVRPGLQDRYLRNRFRNHILERFQRAGDESSEEMKLREIFKAIDLEGNGVLDPHEIRVVLRSAGEPEGVISRIVASLDVNRDGGVDWSEFQEIMGRKTKD